MAAEKREIKALRELGYDIQFVEAEKLTKEEKAAKQEANAYSKKNVEAFLKQAGNEKLWEEYQARYNEQAGTNRKEKQADGSYKKIADEPKFLKDGKPKKKGYANCIGWFREKFTYNEDTKQYEPTVKK